MQNEARSYAINMIDKSYNDISEVVEELAKESPEKMRLLKLKINSLGLYINTLKTLDTQVKGGRRTRRNRRKSSW